MLRNELYTQCEKLAATINLSEFIDQLVVETINSGTLAKTNDNGTSYGLPQLIVYMALSQYTERLKTSIPRPLLPIPQQAPTTTSVFNPSFQQPITHQ